VLFGQPGKLHCPVQLWGLLPLAPFLQIVFILEQEEAMFHQRNGSGGLESCIARCNFVGCSLGNFLAQIIIIVVQD
jgi:hypothetical protein